MTEDMWETPVAKMVDALMDQGRDVYIFGFSADGRRALIVDNSSATVSIASVDTRDGIGRWECTTAHYRAHTGEYARRFPTRGAES